MTDEDPELDEAYALSTPEDNKKLYAKWSDTYEAGFAVDMDYVLPAQVARIFLAKVAIGDGPVLDIGAGTGLLGQHIFPHIDQPIDGLDISREMLDVAASKELYRQLVVADLSQPLAMETAAYGALISSGTFTHGHVGPDALDELLRIAKPGALFVLSINTEHFKARGFEAKFEALADRIRDFGLDEVRNFGDRAPQDHRHDLGNIVSFRTR